MQCPTVAAIARQYYSAPIGEPDGQPCPYCEEPQEWDEDMYVCANSECEQSYRYQPPEEEEAA